MIYKRILVSLSLLIVFSSSVIAQDYKVYDYNTLEPLLHAKNEKVYVVNFWATWCKPCVEEMPAFNSLYEKYNSKNVEIILVSLDFGKNVNDRINTFKKVHKIKSQIVILDDPDGNSWINKVNPDWSGALPATLIFNKDKRIFYERSFSFKDLEKEVLKFL